MKKYFGLLKQTFSEFGNDKAPRLGAALAYYAIFSLAPLLLIVIAISGLAFGHDAAQNKIFEQLKGVLGPSVAASVQRIVRNAARPKSGVVTTIIGIVTLIFGASGVFGQLKDALNTIWDVEPRKGGGIMTLAKGYFLSFVTVFGVGFLLLVSLVIDTVITAIGAYAGDHLPGGEILWRATELAFSFCVITVAMAMIFRMLPDVRIEWRDVWLGAGFTSLLFVLGKFALGVYFAKTAVGSSFGVAGSLVIVLLWAYYSAQIVLFGAEFTQIYARGHGSLKDAKPAEALKSLQLPAVVYKPSAGGAARFLAGGVTGLVIGLLAGCVGALVVFAKSAKKLFT